VRHLFLTCLIVLAVSVPLTAADAAAPPKPQLFLIHEELARPSMLAAYESTTSELLHAMTEKKADPNMFGMDLYMTPEHHYIYVLPLENMGELERFPRMMRRANSAMEGYNEFIVMKRPDLSYQPENPRFKPEEVRFLHWSFYYLDAARAEESEQIAKDFASLFRSKKTGDGFTVYMAMSGQNLPLLIVAEPGKSAADYYANEEKINAAIGADIQPLQMRAMAITRKFETRDGVYRPEMSYPMRGK
jgi:hypothetical protein